MAESGAASGGDALLDRALRLTTHFYNWEHLGRGWFVFDHPVELEPPFQPFRPLPTSSLPPFDDARKPSRIGAWLHSLFGGPSRTFVAERNESGAELILAAATSFPVSVLRVALPTETKINDLAVEAFLLSISTAARPVSFEILGTATSIDVQFVCSREDTSHVREQLRAFFPDAVAADIPDALPTLFEDCESFVVDFGLSEEFMRPLDRLDGSGTSLLAAILGAMGDLEGTECAVVQVLFEKARADWATSIKSAICDWQGEAFFADWPELSALAREKVARPLFAAAVRVGVGSNEEARRWNIAARLAGAFTVLGSPATNELVALSNDDYSADEHTTDLVQRVTRRAGMILSSAELSHIVRLPDAAIRAERLTRQTRRTKAVRPVSSGTLLGTNTHDGRTVAVRVPDAHRLRHTHVVGASGTGKSTLLLNMVLQDIAENRGCALLEPHGDLIEEVLSRIPDHRVDDVVLVNPSDAEYAVGFNVLSAHSELERTLLSSDLVAVFQRLSTSWGDKMTSVLANAIMAFLVSSRGGHLGDLRRFLIEPSFRKEFLSTVPDREVRYFWEHEFPLLSGRPQGSILTRLDAFLRPRLVRNMVAQKTALDFAGLMRDGKILLVKLAQGAIGEENSALLGSLFVGKLAQMALFRQSLPEESRRPFHIYIDEFSHFVTPSMTTLLTSARKYGVGLVLAHQELRQLWNQDKDVAAAVLANTATRIAYRVGDDDAHTLAPGFAHFEARDIQNLRVGQAICRLDNADSDFSLDGPRPLPAPHDAIEKLQRVIETSRQKYATRIAADEAPPPIVATPTAREPVRLAKEVSVNRGLPQEGTPPLSGRGGPQHKYLQELIRRWADANGWRASVEQEVLDGLGRIDVALEQRDTRIACEIAARSKNAYEVGNIRKCLAAGFDKVVLVVVAPRDLNRRRAAVLSELEESERSRVAVLSPDELFAHLGRETTPVNPPTPRTQKIKGYEVTVTGRSDEAERQERQRSIGRTILAAVKRMRKK